MATYVIGDVQGQWHELEALLREVHFAPAVDRLWFVGDLVNRGPDSLAVLRFVRGLGKRATVVLGNHDLHLIGRALGVAPEKRRDTLDGVLKAHDRDALIAWLRSRPLLVRRRGYLLVHAGLLPQWSPRTAARLAREVGDVLRSSKARALLAAYTHSEADSFRPRLKGIERWVVTLNALTRLRACSREGRMRLGFSGPPAQTPKDSVPWFELPGRKRRSTFILFGHWAALGLKRGRGFAALDSGCCWGQALSALRLEDRRVFAVACGARRPSRP